MFNKTDYKEAECAEMTYSDGIWHVESRGGRSHFFRLRLRSCSKIFESGCGYSSNLRIRLLFRLRLQSSI